MDVEGFLIIEITVAEYHVKREENRFAVHNSGLPKARDTCGTVRGCATDTKRRLSISPRHAAADQGESVRLTPR